MKLLKFAHNRYRTVNFAMSPYSRKAGMGIIGASAIGAGASALGARLHNVGKDPEDQKDPLKAGLIGAGGTAVAVGTGALLGGGVKGKNFANVTKRFRTRLGAVQ